MRPGGASRYSRARHARPLPEQSQAAHIAQREQRRTYGLRDNGNNHNGHDGSVRTNDSISVA